MRAIYYSKALYALEKEGRLPTETLAKHFIGTLERNGHMHFLPQIIRGYERLAARQAKRETIRILAALPLSEKDCRESVKNSGLDDTDKAHIKQEIDQTLIGGVIAQKGSKRIDMSYKRELTELYHTLTASH